MMWTPRLCPKRRGFLGESRTFQQTRLLGEILSCLTTTTKPSLILGQERRAGGHRMSFLSIVSKGWKKMSVKGPPKNTSLEQKLKELAHYREVSLQASDIRLSHSSQPLNFLCCTSQKPFPNGLQLRSSLFSYFLRMLHGTAAIFSSGIPWGKVLSFY